MSISDIPADAAAARPSPLRGIFCLCGGSFIFSLQDLVIKLMSDGYPLSQVLITRCLVALIPLYLLLRFGGGGLRALRSRRYGLLLFRAGLLLGAYTTYYLAMATLPLAVVVALFFAAPLFIVVLSGPMLGERVGFARTVAAVIGFVGVVVICFAPVGSEAPTLGLLGGLRDPAALLAVVSALFYGLAALLIRKMAATESGAVMASYQNVVFLMGAALIAIVTNLGTDLSAEIDHQSLDFLLRPWVVPTERDFLLMASTGIVGAVGSFLLTQAYRLAEANVVAPFEYTAILLAVVFGWMLWGEVPVPQTFLGIAMIIGAGLYVLREKRDDGPCVARKTGSVTGND
ncbi:MAG: DMT family transporter [Rhodospirillaceae bacterium]|nr:DMT family transporter [Rhodospirillaceae bacterium]